MKIIQIVRLELKKLSGHDLDLKYIKTIISQNTSSYYTIHIQIEARKEEKEKKIIMIVFGECMKFFHFMGLATQSTELKTKILKIPNYSLQILFSIPEIIMICGELIFVKINSDDFMLIADSFYLAIGLITMIANYVYFIVNDSRIRSAVDFMQSTIDLSE